VRWTGKKITGKSHSGTVDIKLGNISIAAGELMNIDFTMDMTSIKDQTIKDAEDKAKLEGHLKSADFFGTEEYPEASFSMTRTEMDDFKGSIYGDLTIKGQTHEVKADIIVSQSGMQELVASGTMFFDRTQYDVKYGSGTIFTDLGDKAIRDNVPLSFSIKAKMAN
jgi:polyisoprenoid-binding protein YceI